jgi:hypothetical protein
MFTAMPAGELTVSEPILKDTIATIVQTQDAIPWASQELNKAARPEPSGGQGPANAT